MLCACGCGQPAPIAKVSDRRRGVVRGQPQRFVHNHHGRKAERIRVEDRGYVTDCHIWLLTKCGPGYGQVQVDGRRHLAHRWYFAQAYGEIPPGVVVDHLCQQPDCVNVEHLQAVTALRNLGLVRERMIPLVSPEQFAEALRRTVHDEPI